AVQTGGALTLNGTGWVNNATISATTNGTLTFDGTWTNNRPITTTNAFVNFRGTRANTAVFTTNNTVVSVFGTVANGGSGARPGAGGPWVMRGGQIVASTLPLTASARLVATTDGGTLSRLTVAGDIDVTDSNDVHIRVRDGLTLNGTATIGGVGTY